MERAIQKRTLQTRAKLVAAAQQLIDQSGYEALRVEEVVRRAGVAKGTFFAHFKDKDALMDLIIGTEIERLAEAAGRQPNPQNVEEFASSMMPILEFMTCERYVFDVCMRKSGALAAEEVGPIASAIWQIDQVVSGWIASGEYRRDISVEFLSEGVQAFMMQAMALKFCALHNSSSVHERFLPYLRSWLLPTT